MHDARKLQVQIDDYWKFAKSTMSSIIYYYIKEQKRQVRLTHRAFPPSKLDDRAKRLFLHHIEQNLCDNIKTLGIPSKSDQHFSQATVWKYLNADGYFRFKVRKKPFLFIKNKHTRLR